MEDDQLMQCIYIDVFFVDSRIEKFYHVHQ